MSALSDLSGVGLWLMARQHPVGSAEQAGRALRAATMVAADAVIYLTVPSV